MDEKKMIDELRLSVRTHNTLRRAGVDTIGELLDMIESDNLRKVRGLSQNASKEIMQKVYCRNCKRSIWGEYKDCDINIEDNGLYNRGLSLCGCKVRM